MQPLKTFVPQQDRVMALVEDILAKNSPPDAKPNHRDLSTDWDLIEIGLTSVDMVNLMLAVEAEFDVIIPPVQITPENFRSIDSINALLSQLTG